MSTKGYITTQGPPNAAETVSAFENAERKVKHPTFAEPGKTADRGRD